MGQEVGSSLDTLDRIRFHHLKSACLFHLSVEPVEASTQRRDERFELLGLLGDGWTAATCRKQKHRRKKRGSQRVHATAVVRAQSGAPMAVSTRREVLHDLIAHDHSHLKISHEVRDQESVMFVERQQKLLADSVSRTV
jgi:hypothetical protein